MVFQNGEDGVQLGRTKKKKSLGWFLFYFYCWVKSWEDNFKIKVATCRRSSLHFYL